MAKWDGLWRSWLRRQVSNVAFETRGFGGRDETRPERFARELVADQGDLPPTVVARYLREIAQWMDQKAESTAARARAIEAKYGHVFRTAAWISGEYYNPYLDFRAAPERIATARKLQAKALALARKHERHAAKRARRGDTDLGVLPTTALVEALRDVDKDRRIRAAGLLGDLGDPDTVQALIELLDDPELVGEAAKSLRKIGDHRAIEPLIAVLRRSEASDASFAAIAALGEMGDPRAIDPLIERYDSGVDWEKGFITRTLGQIGDQCAVAPLRRILTRLESEPPADDDTMLGRARDIRDLKRALDGIARAHDAL